MTKFNLINLSLHFKTFQKVKLGFMTLKLEIRNPAFLIFLDRTIENINQIQRLNLGSITSALLSLSSFSTVILPFLSPVAKKSPLILYSKEVIESKWEIFNVRKEISN